ncbi:hypothetical protein JEM52_18745 [Citrobacter koseri]|uniref:hypothetical protein n=1 Tax=Citrobacter koseri TaxID=545 RepID=UPI001BE21C31|nr:hypothetical protein [Citrobacter koseri]HCJ7694135.1 hypothetical protein [Citrobacter freundii]MCE5352000.1 hypothetical protein [Citrobacter koseri]HBD3031928.1 hypothetical protein [Citrobacter koseri]HBD3035978.1 hypothetical protein [Citrobacter koseri]HBD3187609.1 hypothetical protein [Citrobacter koseri]
MSNIEKLADDAMFSSIEGFASLVVDSIEFELGRELTEEEHQRVYLHVEWTINNSASNKGGAA